MEICFVKNTNAGKLFIPIVGLFTGGADMQSYTLTIRFKDNIVKFVGQGQMTGGGGNILDQ
jgi:hypothetical protein